MMYGSGISDGKKFWCFPAVLFICSVLNLAYYYSETNRQPPSQVTESVSSNELDGCHHVYLDVGSNIGIQVKKKLLYKLHF